MLSKKNNKKLEELDIENINETVSLSKKILKVLYICLIIGAVFLLSSIASEWKIMTFILNFLKILTPLFIGFIIAWIFNPLVEFLHRNGFKKPIAVILIYLGFLSLVYLFVSMLIPTVVDQFNDLVSSLPSIFSSIKEWIDSVLANVDNINLSTLNDIKDNLYTNVGNIFEGIVKGLPNQAISVLGSVVSGLGTFVISLIIGFYMLFDFSSITRHLEKLLPRKHRYEIMELTKEIGHQLRKYANGVLGVASIVLIGCSLGFAIIGLKAPLLFGLFCGITDLIPYIGPYIGGAAAVIVGFSQSPTTGILALVIIIIVQMLESYVIQPIVMSKRMKLHPVTILVGLTVFGSFFGIIGMILATPTIAFFKIIFRYINKKYSILDIDDEDVILETKKKEV